MSDVLPVAIMQNFVRAVVLALFVAIGLTAAGLGIGAFQLIFGPAEWNLANLDLLLYLGGGIFLVFVVFFLFQGRK